MLMIKIRYAKPIGFAYLFFNLFLFCGLKHGYRALDEFAQVTATEQSVGKKGYEKTFYKVFLPDNSLVHAMGD